MSAQAPNPFPTDGKRKLTPREQFELMDAHACVIPKKLPMRCESQVYVGMFFDGTGNNMDVDYYGGDGSKTEGEGRTPLPPEQRKHTNVVKLYQAFPALKSRGYFRIYLPGVGTPFPEIGDDNETEQSSPNWGSIASEKGEHRIIWALLQLINAPYRYVRGANALLIPNDQAKAICNALASSANAASAPQRRSALKTWQDRLVTGIKNNLPLVTQINLSVFGFSRGAAEARVFVSWLMELCEYKDGGWRFAGMALNVQFLGIFDTVASVGLANLYDDGTLAGHQSWADNALQIHPAVRQCVHMVAGHELRACFPLDSARIKGAYPANVKEVVYPGAHSDVGGGYKPGALGVMLKPADNLSILPGRDMYDAARNAAVPLPVFDNLSQTNQRDLTPSTALVQAYNGYIRESAIQPGPVEAMLRQHMALYHSYRYKWRNDFTTRKMAYVNAKQEAEKKNLWAVQDRFIRSIGWGVINLYETEDAPASVAQRLQGMNKASGIQASNIERRMVEVAQSIDPQRVTPSVQDLFDGFVHDSMAGFKSNMDEYRFNSIGAAKFRTVFKGND